MSTSGSMIGTSPAAMIWRATANCWSTTARMPAGLACLITERILVPKMPLAFARASSLSRSGIGFMSCTPFASASRPLSTFRIGTTFLTFQR